MRKAQTANSFDFFFRKYYAPLVSYASLMLEEQDAKDVVQGVFVWLLQHPDKWHDISSGEQDPGPYMARSDYNACLNKIRGKQSEKSYYDWLKYRSEQDYSVYNPEKVPFIQALFTKEMKRRVEEIADELPARCKEAFLLAYMEGLPHRRIAKIMGVSQSTVENHLYNALKFIRKRLSETGEIIEKKVKNF